MISLPLSEFFDDTGALREAGKRRLRAAIPILLRELRARPAIWNDLEVIEVRGHADPRARRDPYATNLRASQRPGLAVLLFLTSGDGLPAQDRLDLQRLAVASGASHSRPTADCGVRSTECDAKARRVELHIRLGVQSLRAKLGDFYDRVGRLVAPPPVNP